MGGGLINQRRIIEMNLMNKSSNLFISILNGEINQIICEFN